MSQRKRFLMLIAAVLLLCRPTFANDLARRCAALPKLLRPRAVDVSVRNASLYITAGSTLHVRYLDGSLEPMKNTSVSLDDKRSFILKVRDAETSITATDLSALLNTSYLPSISSGLKDIQLDFPEGKVRATGTIKRGGIDIPFSANGSMSLAAGGLIRIHIDRLTAAGVLKKEVLDLFGIHLSKLTRTRPENGFFFEKDDLILDPLKLFPPPRMFGKLVKIRLENDQLVETFGPDLAPTKTAGDRTTRSYIAFRGGDLRMGKMTMNDVDLTLVALHHANNVDFFLDHYREQVQAGYSKSLPSLGLVVYLARYSDCRQSEKAAPLH